MKLSLVSAPVLGFDLTRHPHGDELSRLLLHALAVDSVTLARVAAATPSPDEDAYDDVRARVLAEDDGRLDLPPADVAEGTLAGLAATLVHSLVLTVADLRDLLERDVLAWTAGDPRASGLRSVFVDAATALWTRPHDHPDAALLARRYRERFGDDLALPLTPDPVSVARRLAAVEALDSHHRQLLREQVQIGRPATGDWAQAMHEASWAVVTTDRVRQAAVNQLLTVDAWFRAGFTPADGAEGVWNAVSGHVQALTVADVLADGPRETLTAGRWW